MKTLKFFGFALASCWGTTAIFAAGPLVAYETGNLMPEPTLTGVLIMSAFLLGAVWFWMSLLCRMD